MHLRGLVLRLAVFPVGNSILPEALIVEGLDRAKTDALAGDGYGYTLPPIEFMLTDAMATTSKTPTAPVSALLEPPQ
jgi:hypothetical protein